MALSSPQSDHTPNAMMPRQRSIDLVGQTNVAAYYDGLGVQEWLRLDEHHPRARVLFHLHKSVLQRYVRSGNSVLDAGSGPGRFSIELARLGAHVTAGDLSPVQVVLASQSLQSASSPKAAGRVLGLTVSAIPFRDASFDRVVCFGAVLSHVADGAEDAARELVRVTRPGGVVMVSVQSTANYFLPEVIRRVRLHGLDAMDEAIMQGKDWPDDTDVPWRSFAGAELDRLGSQLGCETLEVTASNVLATVHDIPLLQEIENDQVLWSTYLRWEEHLARQPTNVDRGAHTIAVWRKH
jgi:SAM-dependent methyltransferase